MGRFMEKSSMGKRFYISDSFSLSSMGYDDFLFEKPSRFFRVINYYSWHFVISGKGQLEIGDKTYNIEGGMSFFVPPDTKIRYYPDPANPWEYVWFDMRGDMAAEYGTRLGFTAENAVQEIKNFSQIKSILRKTLLSLAEDNCGYYSVLSAFYKVMDLCIVPVWRTEIVRVRELIDESFAMSDFNVEKLCTDVGFSHAQLLRLFKKEYGKTVIRYVIEKRMELARELLETTDMPLDSVARSCGFDDAVYFMKRFKREHGITPGEYRGK